jgi:RimJ/RimL family protein N-acetyltransferase
MRFIGFEREEEAEAWARGRIGINEKPEFFRAMASVDSNDEFMFVVVLTNFTKRNVDINIAIDGSKMAPRGTVEIFNEVFSFIFDKLHIARVTGLVKDKNKQSKNIVEHFGFKSEGVMREVFEDDNLHIYGFLAREYYSHKWYRGKT